MGGDNGEPQLLANAYRNSLKLAVENEVRTISLSQHQHRRVSLPERPGGADSRGYRKNIPSPAGSTAVRHLRVFRR